MCVYLYMFVCVYVCVCVGLNMEYGNLARQT